MSKVRISKRSENASVTRGEMGKIETSDSVAAVRRKLASVIIANFNYGRFLADAIESSLSQTYPQTEVIVVDDGSTDDSREVIERFANRVRAVLKENGGQASAFNAGFEVSRGEVIIFLDADDYLLPGAVEEACRLLADPKVVRAHWPLREVDELARPTGSLRPNKPLDEGDLRDHVIRYGPYAYNTSPTSGSAWAGSFIRRVFPIGDCGDKHGADAYLNTLAPLYGPIVKSEYPLACYRIHGSNFSGGQSVIENFKRYLKRYDYYCELFSEHLKRQGVVKEISDWKEWRKGNPYYLWGHNALQTSEELTDLIHRGETFILAGEDELGLSSWLEGRISLPFTDRDGQYWGPPSDSAAAILELEAKCEAGAKYLVFTSSSFWWLDYYSKLNEYLASRYHYILHNERVIVYLLSEQS
jgi:glycosyltransferase involved in cell wall biosynthesis